MVILFFIPLPTLALSCPCAGSATGSCGNTVSWNETEDVADADACTALCERKTAEAVTRAETLCSGTCCKCRHADRSLREVSAATQEECESLCGAEAGGAFSFLFSPVPCARLTGEAGEPTSLLMPSESVEWTSPIGDISPTQLIGRVIKTVLGILGAIALAMFVYGGFVWMTSGGSPEKIKSARMTLVWAVLGMAVIFLSYAAVDFVLKAFGV